jgi:hypothetical protein
VRILVEKERVHRVLFFHDWRINECRFLISLSFL